MSFDAIRWALSQKCLKSSTKFVLVAMADCVNSDGLEEMICWPSYKHLKDSTGQDIKTVEAGLRSLREIGYITDTMERKGATNQVIVYRLNTPVIGGVTALPRIDESALNTPVFGALETDGKTPVFPVKTPVFPIKHPRFSRERPPKTGDGTSNGTSNGTSKEQEDSARIVGISAELLGDYMQVRKAKRAGPLTKTAIAALTREAGKAGLSVEDAVTACCEFGWQGFNAGWYLERVSKNQGQIKSKTSSKHTGFSQMNYREGIAEDGTIA